MWKVLVVVCALGNPCSMFVEDPIQYYNTEAECLEAAVIKDKETREMLSDEDGYLTVSHLEIGCTNIYN